MLLLHVLLELHDLFIVLSSNNINMVAFKIIICKPMYILIQYASNKYQIINQIEVLFSFPQNSDDDLNTFLLCVYSSF